MPRLTFIYTRIIILTVLVSVYFIARLAATPINNYSETAIFHTITGTDKFYTRQNKGEVRFYLSPFYQHANSGRNGEGRACGIGDRLGTWNMSGLFFGKDASPYSSTFDTKYPWIKIANDAIASATPYRDEDTFNPDTHIYSNYGSVHVFHEKMGLRGQLNCDFGFGLGVAVKGGFVNYKEKPTFNQQAAPTDATTFNEIKAALMDVSVREKVFKDIGLYVNQVYESALEDTHLQLYWHFPIAMQEHGEESLSIVPYFAVGTWIPTGKVKDQDKAFSINTGNGGFYGISGECSLGFDFPKMIQMSFGGGAIIMMKKEFKNYRVPSSNENGTTSTRNPIYQSGFYPWKTTIENQPGVTWYANASVTAHQYSDSLSLYLDYLYVNHQRDSITLKESNTTKAGAFSLGKIKLEDESIWKSQMVNLGLDYKVNSRLSFGGMLQAHIAGARVFRTTTILGSMTLLF